MIENEDGTKSKRIDIVAGKVTFLASSRSDKDLENDKIINFEEDNGGENVVCEDDNNVTMYLSTSDIEIIKEIREDSVLFNSIANNPKRFFSSFYKKNI